MSRARHRASGGRTSMWVSGNPDVKKEAEDEKNEGGSGNEGKKNGGKVVKVKAHHRMHGGAVKARADRPRRASGGSVNSDDTPFTRARSGSSSPGGSSDPGDTYGGTPSD